MKIFTAKGDRGKTSLLFGGEVLKDNLRIECLGGLDELNSFLGLAKSMIKEAAFKKLINDLQNDIYIISSEIATESKNLNKLQIRFSKERLFRIEAETKNIARIMKLKNYCFFTPGENISSALLDVCRTIARRVERRIVSLNHKTALNNNLILPYLNRLSTLLFVLARQQEKAKKS